MSRAGHRSIFWQPLRPLVFLRASTLLDHSVVGRTEIDKLGNETKQQGQGKKDKREVDFYRARCVFDSLAVESFELSLLLTLRNINYSIIM